MLKIGDENTNLILKSEIEKGIEEKFNFFKNQNKEKKYALDVRIFFLIMHILNNLQKKQNFCNTEKKYCI